MSLRFENNLGGSALALLRSLLLAALGALGGSVVAGGQGARIGGVLCFVLSVLYLSAVQKYGRPANCNLVQAFFLALLFPTPLRLLVVLGLAVCCVGALHLPMVNYLVVQVSWPVFEANPGFQKTGPDIEWWFFGPKVKSLEAFVVFLLYFMAVCYPLSLSLGYRELRKREQERHRWRCDVNETAEPSAAADGSRDAGDSAFGKEDKRVEDKREDKRGRE